jgi:hypothetical protein
VQLGLDPQYPVFGSAKSRLQLVGIHQRPSRHSSIRTADLLAPFALHPALPGSAAGRHARDYYEASTPPDGHQPATDLPTTVPDGQCKGDRRAVPTFTTRSIGQGGAQLYSGSIATPTPQTFSAASPPPELHGFGVDHHNDAVAAHCTPARIHQI